MNITNFDLKLEKWNLTDPDSPMNKKLDIGELTFLILDPIVILGGTFIALVRATGVYDLIVQALNILSASFGFFAIALDEFRADGETGFNYFNFLFTIAETILDTMEVIRLSVILGSTMVLDTGFFFGF
ncbi:unnamed protein product [Meganyctiphanes norvegica]|uniref:Uncharacterized protein n=1 Tax=Meganyctiphanes norvegica TaxID=48144 RepID=A0AAV2Q972_MEGNR